ncbi:MAG: hypothetical protein HY791_07995 [Deltaproteobacteria bacterium]|nr:hypothetical protein [Deltaproteobacteria bacterium]
MTIRNDPNTVLFSPGPEELPADLLDLLIDEAERGLLVVEGRIDSPGQRVLTGDSSADDEETPPGIPELRLAMAELVDAHPGIASDLDRAGERARTLGPLAAAVELASNPHVLDLARLTLETFFRAHPTADSFERSIEELEEARNPEELYEMMSKLLESLRSRLN